ncbi:MAG: hypothetical protein LBC60_02320 [Spirochaetaceae bacterium]|jgi:hypothetical protein|nr:hypothetical protein [Spirochaetaceae bacterium]
MYGKENDTVSKPELSIEIDSPVDNDIRSIISIESGHTHHLEYESWYRFDISRVPYNFNFCKSDLYINKYNSLGFSRNDTIEDDLFNFIVRNINQNRGKIHYCIFNGEIDLSVCYLKRKNEYGLLYSIDDEPPAIYFGYIDLRSNLNTVTNAIGTEVCDSILRRRRILLDELRRKAIDR